MALSDEQRQQVEHRLEVARNKLAALEADQNRLQKYLVKNCAKLTLSKVDELYAQAGRLAPEIKQVRNAIARLEKELRRG